MLSAISPQVRRVAKVAHVSDVLPIYIYIGFGCIFHPKPNKNEQNTQLPQISECIIIIIRSALEIRMYNSTRSHSIYIYILRFHLLVLKRFPRWSLRLGYFISYRQDLYACRVLEFSMLSLKNSIANTQQASNRIGRLGFDGWSLQHKTSNYRNCVLECKKIKWEERWSCGAYGLDAHCWWILCEANPASMNNRFEQIA